jgi:hypothetical protein
MNAITTEWQRWWILMVTAFVVLCSSGTSRADNLRMPAAPLASYQQECASCHTAYPPGLLPAGSWQRIMDSLGQHYGVNASLDAPTAHEISQWLRANAATFKRAREMPPNDRITRAAWFARKHHEIAGDVWKRASVRTPANCTACHGRAEHGSFSEHEVRVPK